ncbi:Exonuclease V, chloroplastic [Linum perenne]
MTHSSSSSSPLHHPPTNSNSPISEISIEIVSEEEMAFYEAATTMAVTRSLSSCSNSSSFLLSIGTSSITSIPSPTLPPILRDIEDSATLNKKNPDSQSLFHMFRKNQGLYVTDITSAEWCEKQMEFVLRLGKRTTTKAMKAGSARHLKLEEEVVTRVKVNVESTEDSWALKFVNFITGVNQLLFQGLTRELQVIGFVEGVFVVGRIDEIRMPEGDDGFRRPFLVDTKTRASDTLPSEPQTRNGRLQLMCYKYILDSLVAGNFPADQFYEFFSLNRDTILSKEIRETAKEAGIPDAEVNTIIEAVLNKSVIFDIGVLPAADRYELQKDNSLLCEDVFRYDFDWVEAQMQASFEFWFSKREPGYTPEDERWKCRFCQFGTVCPVNPMFVKETNSPMKNSTCDIN